MITPDGHAVIAVLLGRIAGQGESSQVISKIGVFSTATGKMIRAITSPANLPWSNVLWSDSSGGVVVVGPVVLNNSGSKLAVYAFGPHARVPIVTVRSLGGYEMSSVAF